MLQILFLTMTQNKSEQIKTEKRNINVKKIGIKKGKKRYKDLQKEERH